MIWLFDTGLRLLGFLLLGIAVVPFVGAAAFFLAKLWWAIIMLASAWMLFG